jgi:hypothetical protein
LVEVDRLLGLHAPPPERGPRDPVPPDQRHVANDSVYNNALACFLENVLPVHRKDFALVAPLIGPNIRAFAEEYEQWWLQPTDFLPTWETDEPR